MANLDIGTGDDKISYFFEGWYLHPDFSGPEITEIDDAMPFGNLTLYAKWDAEIKINYDYGTREGVFNPNPETLLISERPFTLEEASLPGYKFLGWYLRSDFSGPKITKIDHTFPVESITLYAKFGAEIYTITYDLGIASGIVTLPDESPADYSAEDFPLDLPVLDECVIGAGEDAVKYSFAGWYTDPDFSGSAITAIDEGIPFADLTLYAKWDIVEEYAISYDFRGLESVDNPNPETIAISDLPFELLPATLAGYEFVGWYLDPDYSGEPVTSIPAGLTEGMALYGKFEVAPQP